MYRTGETRRLTCRDRRGVRTGLVRVLHVEECQDPKAGPFHYVTWTNLWVGTGATTLGRCGSARIYPDRTARHPYASTLD